MTTALLRKQRRLLRALRLNRRPAPERPIADHAENVAVIMDGNGRWAKSRNLPLLAGHRAGTKALRRTVEAAPDLGIRNLAVFAFSTENWGRPDDEVADLMVLFEETIREQFPDLQRQGVRMHFIGRRDRCPDSLRELMHDMETRTHENTRLDLWVAFDYGARAEVVAAARRLVEDGVEADGDRRAGRRSPYVRSADARSRPRHPHLRRAARFQLSAVAGGLCRVPLHLDALAGLRRG